MDKPRKASELTQEFERLRREQGAPIQVFVMAFFDWLGTALERETEKAIADVRMIVRDRMGLRRKG